MKKMLNIKGIDYAKAYSIIVVLLNHSTPNSALYKVVSMYWPQKVGQNLI